jgi:hypothetical protein
MGVASVSKKHAIKEFNDKDEYDQWYFVYDPRLEQSGGITVAAPRGGGSATGSSGDTKNPDPQATPVQTPPPTPTPQN